MQIADVFKSLSDETRLQTLLLLHKEGELCVCELVEALQISQPKLSRHLALLRNSGLVSDQRRDQWVYYRIHETLPDWVNDLLKTAYKASKDTVKAHRKQLANMANRPNCCN